MKREYAGWMLAIGALLLIGFLIGRGVAVPQSHVNETVRAWMWEHRGLDVLVQVGLILTGALCVAAILPRHRDDHDHVDERTGD